MKRTVLLRKSTLTFQHRIAGTLALAFLFIGFWGALVILKHSPIHDTFMWLPFFDYFYNTLSQGEIPWWNPYSQLGTPFFPVFQVLGLLEPSNFVMALLYNLPGFTSLSVYLIHLCFLFYVYILGAYFTLFHITKSVCKSLLFSIVLFLSLLPTFMRQMGVVTHHFLLPFITYFILSFFSETHYRKKGLLLVAISFICAISLHVHVPVGFLFHLGLLLCFCLVLGVGDFKETLRFLVSRPGLTWLSLAASVAFLIVLPIFALQYYMSSASEIFGSNRFLHATGKNLVQFYASDLPEGSVYFSEFTQRISLTLYNLLGFIFEPYTHVLPFPEGIFLRLSEVRLYLGLMPILCVIAALVKRRTVYTWLFMLLSLLMVLVASNFGLSAYSQGVNGTLLQCFVLRVFPWFKVSEPLQNLGGILIFDLTVLAASGLNSMSRVWKKNIFIISAVLVFTKYVGGGYLSLREYWIGRILLIGVVLILLLSLLIALFFRGQWLLIAVVVIVDMFIYNYTLLETYISNDNYDFLKHEELLSTKRENVFTEYRDPPDHATRYPIHGTEMMTRYPVHGTEMMTHRRPVFNRLTLSLMEIPSPLPDQFFMTRYYYDYLANVFLEKQIVTSGFRYPLLNFFPSANVVHCDNKYEVVDRINQASLELLGESIFIEKDQNVSRPIKDMSLLLSKNRYSLTPEEKERIRSAGKKQKPGSEHAVFSVIEFGANQLGLHVKTSRAGSVYFADGFSKYWKAYVNGKATEIEKTNINFKSVQVPSGESIVCFIYDPVFYRYSVYLCFAGYVLFVLVIGSEFIRKI